MFLSLSFAILKCYYFSFGSSTWITINKKLGNYSSVHISLVPFVVVEEIKLLMASLMLAIASLIY